MQLQHEMAHARRNYADQATIEEYTKQLNELVSAKMTCKGVNQVIPMKLQTEKFGVDYWAMPAFTPAAPVRADLHHANARKPSTSSGR